MIQKLVAAFLFACLISPMASAEVSDKAVVLAPSDKKINWVKCPLFFTKDCRIGVLNGDPTKPNTDLLFKVGPGAVLPHHRHTSAERMVLLSGELKITYDGQDEVTWKKGEYAYGPPGLGHKGECVDGEGAEPCVLFIAFEGPVDATPITE